MKASYLATEKPFASVSIIACEMIVAVSMSRSDPRYYWLDWYSSSLSSTSRLSKRMVSMAISSTKMQDLSVWHLKIWPVLLKVTNLQTSFGNSQTLINLRLSMQHTPREKRASRWKVNRLPQGRMLWAQILDILTIVYLTKCQLRKFKAGWNTTKAQRLSSKVNQN